MTARRANQARRTRRKPQASRQRSKKYYAYVEVANSVHRPYAEDLATYQNVVKPVLDAKKKEDSLLFPSSSPMSRVNDNLDKARAMKPDLAELDGPANAYSDALANAVPLDREVATPS